MTVTLLTGVDPAATVNSNFRDIADSLEAGFFSENFYRHTLTINNLGAFEGLSEQDRSLVFTPSSDCTLEAASLTFVGAGASTKTCQFRLRSVDGVLPYPGGSVDGLLLATIATTASTPVAIQSGALNLYDRLLRGRTYRLTLASLSAAPISRASGCLTLANVRTK